jgi:hypothetical protein
MASGQQASATPPHADENEELAKKLSNPISDLVSVPLQFNWEQHVGPYELSLAANSQEVIAHLARGAFQNLNVAPVCSCLARPLSPFLMMSSP